MIPLLSSSVNQHLRTVDNLQIFVWRKDPHVLFNISCFIIRYQKCNLTCILDI
jgi:hypothetical protein